MPLSQHRPSFCVTFFIVTAFLTFASCSRNQDTDVTVKEIPGPLQKIVNPEVRNVAERLFDPHPEARVIAVRKLAIMADQDAVDCLIHTVQVDQPSVKAAALEALSVFPCQETIATCIDALSLTDRTVGAAAMTTLISMGEPAENAVITAMNSPQRLIRLRSALILANMHTDAALKPLITLFENGEIADIAIAAQGLAIVNDEGWQFLAERFSLVTDPEILKQVALALAVQPERAFSFLGAFLTNDSTPESRKIASIEGLRATGSREAEQVLLPLLGSSRGSVLLNAVLALGDCGTDRSLAAFDTLEADAEPFLFQMIQFSRDKIKARIERQTGG